MPATQILLFRPDADRPAAVRMWLRDIKKKKRRAYAKCLERIKRLARFGRELTRPLAAHLRDGIYELRIRSGNEQYRILYFFNGKNSDDMDVVVLTNGLQKEAEVPPEAIEHAIACRKLIEADRERFTTGWNT